MHDTPHPLFGTQLQATEDEREIHAWLQTKIAAYLALQPADISIHEPFINYGLDSASAVSLSGELGEWLGRDFSPTLVYDYPDILRLARYLVQISDTPQASDTPITLSSNTNEPIALVGIGCRFPGDVQTPEDFWQLLISGEPVLREIPAERWNINDYYDPDPSRPGKIYTRYGAFLTDIAGFDNHFFGISPAEALRMDPQQRLLLEVAWEALENANLAADQLDGSKTAVFLGFMNNLEYTQLQMHSGDLSCVNDPYFGIGGSSSITSGRLSYLFNFQGPNLALDTACSSSLVALHLACQSLRSNECNLALVGGVNTMLLPQSMINACKMRMLAADGLCKTFDELADGYTVGEGCGVVVLKRLSDALANQDNILAIVRGSALNQDGRSNGITAPNRLAQEAVITQALASAGVAPQQISYVEAHGSGTPLGDTIEIEALQATLGKDRAPHHPLLVGSVKTNIGHLAGAAGIAGLIKTILTLQHKTIPPHLNLKNPSPTLPSLHSTIQVPTTLTAWITEGQPRMAGVSSFGWSGTNAHVVLEEAPQVAPSDPSQPWQLLTFSARTPSALDQQCLRLADHLHLHPEHELADVAFTLHTGRSTLPYRRTLLCQDREQALSLLSQPSSPLLISRWQEQRDRPVAFLLPGLGELYPGVLHQLVNEHPLLRDLLDEGADLLQDLLGDDLRPWRSPAPAFPADGLPTVWAQPLTFLLDYALAQLLASWGIRPCALLGYSVGEYVAACLAGLFDWREGLRLLVRRAQLIEHYAQPGGLLAVAQSAQQILPFLGDGIELSASTGSFSCVLGGPADALARLQRLLLSQGIAARPVQARHAFHTSLLQPAAQAWKQELAHVQWQTPHTPWLSNLTGEWISPQQACDPEYWAEQMCRPVQFVQCAQLLLEQPEWMLVEVGPGQTLSSYTKMHPVCSEARRQEIVATVRGERERTEDQTMLLTLLSKLWLAGVSLNWTAYWSTQKRQRLSLPTYPFERQRFWIEGANHPPAQTNKQDETLAMKKPDLADWFYLPSWKQEPLPPGSLEKGTQSHCWLVFLDECGVGEYISAQLEDQNQVVVRVRATRQFAHLADGSYSINSGTRLDYETLLHELSAQERIPDRIVYLWTVTPRRSMLQEQDLEETLDKSFYSLLLLMQAIESAGIIAGQIDLITSDMQDITGDEQLSPAKAAILGLYHTIPLEYPTFQCHCIDITLPDSGSLQKANLLKQLLQELLSKPTDALIALRGNHRWKQVFDPIQPESKEVVPLRQNGVYLITGGLGGIGLAMAEYLARSVKARLVLVGRTPLPPRNDWDNWLGSMGAEEGVGYQLHKVLFLEALGAEVQTFAADVANQKQMQSVIQQTIDTFGHLDGVIHAAGIPGAGLIRTKTAEQASRVLAPKINGTIVLDRVLQNVPLDFLALFSSITASIGGGPGQVDYCAANAFLGAFAHTCHSSSEQRRVIALDWGEWQWNAWEGSLAGEALREVRDSFRENRQRFGITFEEGTEAFKQALALNVPRVVIATQNIEELLALSKAFTITNILQRVTQKDPLKATYPRPMLGTPYVAPRNELERTIATLWGNMLGISEVGVDDNFFELGGNSLLGIDLIMHLGKEMHMPALPAHVLYEAPTISAIARYMEQGAQVAFIEERDTRGRKRRETLENRRNSVRGKR